MTSAQIVYYLTNSRRSDTLPHRESGRGRLSIQFGTNRLTRSDSAIAVTHQHTDSPGVADNDEQLEPQIARLIRAKGVFFRCVRKSLEQRLGKAR